MKINEKTIFLHKDPRSLSIYAFFMIAKTNDFRYLIKGFNEDEEDSYEEFKESEELSIVFENIINDYKGFADEKAFAKQKAYLLLTVAKMKYSTASRLLNYYTETQDIFYIKSMAPLGFKFYEEKPLGEQLDKIIKTLIGMKNALNIKEIKYKNKYEKEEEDDEEEEDVFKALENLEEKALSLEIELELGYKINIKKTSMSRWHNMLKMSNQKRKAYGKGKN